MNSPNLITIGRLLLALVVFGVLLHSHYYELAALLTVLVIVGDYLDGWAARQLQQSSKFGAWLDIAADRVIEIGYWIVFAALGWVSTWIALLFLLRGILVDGMRSFAQQHGFTAFGERSMMQSSWGRFLVASPFMRFAYAALKALTFTLVIVAQSHPVLDFTGQVLVYLTALVCLLRGIPVLLEGQHFLKE